MKKFAQTVLAITACCVIGVMSYAAVVVDDEGVGFVGKGDVQSLFGWNNAALQTCATSTSHVGYDEDTDAGCLRFSFNVFATTKEENTWLCKVANNPNEVTVERNNTATVTVSGGGIAASEARARNQVNGFNLNGGEWTVSESVTVDGHATNSCQGMNTFVAGSTETTVTDLGSIRELTITDMRDGTTHTIEIPDEVDEE